MGRRLGQGLANFCVKGRYKHFGICSLGSFSISIATTELCLKGKSSHRHNINEFAGCVPIKLYL